VYRHQHGALKRVDTELIQLCWEIGKEINSQQREQGWGKSVVEVLAKELQKEFPGIKGFRNATFGGSGISMSSIQCPQICHQQWQKSQSAIVQPMVAEISWTKNVVIMQMCKDPLERDFYIRMTKRYGWTKMC